MRTKNKLFIILVAVILPYLANVSYSERYIVSVENQYADVINKCVYFDLYIRSTHPSPDSIIYLATSSWCFTFNKSNFINLDIQVVDGSTSHFYNSLGADCSDRYTITAQFISPLQNIIQVYCNGPDPSSQTLFNQRVARISDSASTHRVGRFRVAEISNFSGSFGLHWGKGVYAADVWAYDTFSPFDPHPITGDTVIVPEQPLPVYLSDFSFSVIRNTVKLNWTTIWEVNNAGFAIERNVTGKNQWLKIGDVPGHGTTNEPQYYSFEDKNLNTGSYKYRLKQLDYNGNFEYFHLSSDVVIGKPGEYNMSQNYPNPSNPVSKINYELPFDSKVTLVIYDILGQEVKKLVDENKTAGYYTVTFDGSNLASGIYFYRIQTESYSKTLKLVLIK